MGLVLSVPHTIPGTELLCNTVPQIRRSDDVLGTLSITSGPRPVVSRLRLSSPQRLYTLVTPSFVSTDYQDKWIQNFFRLGS